MANTTGKKFGGRKKGTPNKDTKQLREKIEMLLSDQWHQIQKDIQDLKPKDRIDTYIKLLEYSLPKLNRQYINPELDGQPINTPIFQNNPLCENERATPPIEWTDEPELTAEKIKLINENIESKY